MLSLLKQQRLSDQILQLSTDEIKDPYSVLTELFIDHKFHEIREFLGDVAETCLTTDRHPFSDAEVRSDCLHYINWLVRCVEASALIAGQRKES
jgi:hypothetical protein